MTPIQLDHTAKVLAEMLTFKQPADAVLSAYFREHKKLGRQDRHEIAETAFAALRHYQKISAVLSRPHAQPRKAALAALVLGRSTNISQIKDLLDEEETEFLSSLKARKTEFSDDLHTAAELPQWLVEQLQKHFSDGEILAFGRSINQAAPLDIRVNTLKGRRDKVLPLLQAESPDAEATSYSPWGIRLKKTKSPQQTRIVLDGTLEAKTKAASSSPCLSVPNAAKSSSISAPAQAAKPSPSARKWQTKAESTPSTSPKNALPTSSPA